MKNFIACIFLFLVGIVFYGATVRGVYGDIDMSKVRNNLDKVTKPLELSPERGRYVLTYSLAERNSFALDEKLATVADPDVGYYEGRYYVFFAPGISVLAIPFYLIGKIYNIPQVASFFTISLFATLNLISIYLISRKVFKISIALSLLSAIIFGFGSTSWNYAITMYQHHVTTFLILSSFLSVYYYKSAYKNGIRWLYAFYVWFAYGLAIFLDYPNILLMAPIIGYLLFSAYTITFDKKKYTFSFDLSVLITSVIFFALIALHGYYNYTNFGSWSRLSGSLIGFDKVREARGQSKNKNATKTITELANQKEKSSFFQEENLPHGFAILTFSPDRGIFIFSPIFYLALFGIYLKVKKRINVETFFLLSVIFVNFFLYSSWGDPWGGWAFGPRYLIPTMAIASCFIAYWIHKGAHPIFSRLLAYMLFIFSASISLLGALTTNQVPPKVEADFYGINYNFFLNLEQFFQGHSSSFVFNHFFSQDISLARYYLVILLSLTIIVTIITFLIPIKTHED